MRFIKAVNANLRRFSSPGNMLNAELTAVDMQILSDNCFKLLWSSASRIAESVGVAMLDACATGEYRTAT